MSKTRSATGMEPLVVSMSVEAVSEVSSTCEAGALVRLRLPVIVCDDCDMRRLRYAEEVKLKWKRDA